MSQSDLLPITGLCVVADPAKCPPGYELLYYSHDRRDDCDLWKDSFFKARVTRYLCVTRKYPLDGGRLNNVLCDVVIQNEKEIPPSGYTLLEKTLDTSDKATRKKQVSVQLLPRSSTHDAITELIILSKSRRAPPGYTLTGEINGLLFCFKIGVVPADSLTANTSAAPSTPNSVPNSSSPVQPYSSSSSSGWGYMPHPPPPSLPHSSPSHGYAGVPYNANTPQWGSTNHVPLVSPVSPSTASLQGTGAPNFPNQHHELSRQNTLTGQRNAMEGVPFQLNSRLKDHKELCSAAVNDISYRSLRDLENEYSYSFRLENGAAVQRQVTSM